MEWNQDDVFRGVGVEIDLPTDDAFLKVKETLTRIGIASRKEKKLFQSCHILHKRGKYAILHFKELFMLDGKEDNFDYDDLARRNAIVKLLDEWGLVENVRMNVDEPTASLSQIKILAYRDKDDWELIPKYNIGRK